MLEVGVANILGMLRTDTPYSKTDRRIQGAAECKDPSLPCIEVKLELSSFWTRARDRPSSWWRGRSASRSRTRMASTTAT